MQDEKGKKSTRVPTDYDFFTSVDVKSSDLCIYYNTALDNTIKIKKKINGLTPMQVNAFWGEYLWKAHKKSKNSNGYFFTEEEEKLVKDMLEKLEEIRNFHSHIWHDNVVLKFEESLYRFVNDKYKEAKAVLYATFPKQVDDYECLEKKGKGYFSLFKWVKEKKAHYITIEGRIFFLSFFLTSGQMNAFLQKRRGFKRSDISLYKIKRLLYTFYSHRDGASISGINLENRVVDSIEIADRVNIYRARSAAKLITYLYDYPDYWANPDCMPLLDGVGIPIKEICQLKEYIERWPALMPEVQFQLSAGDSPLNSISFTCNNFPGYTFQIDFKVLYRLILLLLLQKDAESGEDTLTILMGNLREIVEARKELHTILTRFTLEKEEDLMFLLDRKNQHLRGSGKLTQQSITFFGNLEKGNLPNRRHAVMLANAIRCMDNVWAACETDIDDQYLKPEAIRVYQQDMVLRQQRKFRSGNRFLWHLANYLASQEKCTWFWGVESFQFYKKDQEAVGESLIKVKKYVPGREMAGMTDFRFTIENDHLFWAIDSENKGVSNHERFWQFSIGAKALRYLSAYMIKDENGFFEKASSFLKLLAQDLQKLRDRGYWNPEDTSNYTLLEKQYVAGYLHQDQYTVAHLKEKVEKRLQHIYDQWDAAISKKIYLKRASKNRLIMNAYRFFEWPKDQVTGQPKFFRINEYNETSICHYSLDEGQKKFENLFCQLFRLDQRKPPIPESIRNILRKASSLDCLMELVFADRKQFLQRKWKEYATLPVQQLKKELPEFCRLLGISVPVNLLKERDKQILKEKHTITLGVQPYAIHPLLIIKHFFPHDYSNSGATKKSSNKNGSSFDKRPAINVLSDLRKNKSLKRGLVPAYYSDHLLTALDQQDCGEKQKHILKKRIYFSLAEDMILFWIVQRLFNNPYTKNVYEVYFKNGASKSLDFKIEELYKTRVPLRLQEGNRKELYTSVLVHQLDDIMFMTAQEKLYKAAVHRINRQTTEIEMWREHLQSGMPNEELNQMPDGSRDAPIPFELLRREIELARKINYKLAEYIFEFEKKTHECFLQNNAEDKIRVHLDLKKKYHEQQHNVHYSLPYLNFDGVLAMAGIVETKNVGKLSEWRNIVIHDDIPQDNSFDWQLKRHEQLMEVLKIKGLLYEVKNRSMYQQESK